MGFLHEVQWLVILAKMATSEKENYENNKVVKVMVALALLWLLCRLVIDRCFMGNLMRVSQLSII
mgnify:CR=1 FL=1